MTFALLFVILLLLLGLSMWPAAGRPAWQSNIIVFLLFVLLGWSVFGPLLHK